MAGTFVFKHHLKVRRLFIVVMMIIMNICNLLYLCFFRLILRFLLSSFFDNESFKFLSLFATHQVASSVQLFNFSPSLLSALPLLSVSFTGHYNAPRLYYELGATRSISQWRIVTIIALSICFCCYSGKMICI